MDKTSILGILLSIVVISLLIIESLLLVKTLKSKNKYKLFLHLLGVISTFLVSIFTISSTLKIEFESPNIAIVTFILSSIFFIYLGIDTLMIDKISDK